VFRVGEHSFVSTIPFITNIEHFPVFPNFLLVNQGRDFPRRFPSVIQNPFVNMRLPSPRSPKVSYIYHQVLSSQER
jgi:hypothetical protein